jgi:hypothetical protein
MKLGERRRTAVFVTLNHLVLVRIQVRQLTEVLQMRMYSKNPVGAPGFYSAAVPATHRQSMKVCPR